MLRKFNINTNKLTITFLRVLLGTITVYFWLVQTRVRSSRN